MKLYDESIKELLAGIDMTSAKKLDIVNATWKDVGDHNLILRADMAYELGGGTFPAVSGMAVTCNDEFVNMDEVMLIGPDLDEIKALGITDSKLMTDEYILEIGPRLIKRFDYNHLALPNEKYNEVHDEMNMNAIKAKMHNRCVLNLLKKHHGVAVYQDQFAEEKLYYKYLKDEPEVARGIKFSTKGERLFPSVALGSVIARYSFLREMQAMSKKYGVKFPFGASTAVTKFAEQFAKKYGKDELKKVAKINFANYKEIE